MFRPHLKTAKQLFVHPQKNQRLELCTLSDIKVGCSLWEVGVFLLTLSIFYLPRSGRVCRHLTLDQSPIFHQSFSTRRKPNRATIHPTYSISIAQYIFAQNIQVISFWGKCNLFIQVKRREETFIKKMIVTGAFVSILIYLQLWHLKKTVETLCLSLSI